jgi:hypothetical protein
MPDGYLRSEEIQRKDRLDPFIVFLQVDSGFPESKFYRFPYRSVCLFPYRSFFTGRLQVCQTSDLVYMKEKKDRGKYFKECSVEKERANSKRMSSRESIHERKEQATCDPGKKKLDRVCDHTIQRSNSS